MRVAARYALLARVHSKGSSSDRLNGERIILQSSYSIIIPVLRQSVALCIVLAYVNEHYSKAVVWASIMGHSEKLSLVLEHG